MIAAAGLEAIRRGEYLIVLGELHAAINTLTLPLFLNQHPQPDDLIRARERDLPEPCIAPVWSKARSRADLLSLSRHDLDLENGATRSWRPRTQVVPVSSLVVEEIDHRLVVRTRDHRLSFDVIAFFEQHLIAESYARFSIAPDARHSPRIVVDEVVLARERWRFTPDEVPFVHLEEPLDRYLGARRWARQHGLPRFVFFKVPEEPKPCYLDFDSAIYLEVFVKMVRTASVVHVTEMLPTIDDTWLIDRSGNSYTAELRIAAVDPEPWCFGAQGRESGK
jgi:hypothetical protein